MLKPRNKFKNLLIILFGFSCVLAVGYGVRVAVNSHLPSSTTWSALSVDFREPDVLLLSNKLSAFPKDMLSYPLLQDMLSKDLIEYYEQHEDLLNIKGAVKRLAFEQEQGLPDWLFKNVLDESAQLALWRNEKGRLEHFTLAVDRNQVTKTLNWLTGALVDEAHLKQVTTIKVNGDEASVFVLPYQRNKMLAFVIYQDKLVLASHAGLWLEGDKLREGVSDQLVALLLPKDARSKVVSSWQKQLVISSNALSDQVKHQVFVSHKFLSFDYQLFFPGLVASRFDFNPTASSGAVSWQQHALLERQTAKQWGASNIWQIVPNHASVCVALPVAWQSTQSIFEKIFGDAAQANHLINRLSSAGAVCWYADSILTSPLFVVKLSDELPKSADANGAKNTEKFDIDQTLNALFLQSVAGDSVETTANVVDKKNVSKKLVAAKKVTPNIVSSTQDAFVSKTIKGISVPAKIWSKTVASPYGFGSDGDTQFKVKLAHVGQWLIFSPDGKLVERSLQTIGKTYPGLNEQAGANTLLHINPHKLAKMLRTEVLETVPRDKELVMHDAVTRLLIPRLEKLANYPIFNAQLDVSKTKDAQNQTANSSDNALMYQWVPLSWSTQTQPGAINR